MNQLKCFNCGDDHLVWWKFVPNWRKLWKRHPTLQMTQGVHTNFIINVLLEMWQNINKWLKVLKFDTKKISTYIQKQFHRGQHSKSQKAHTTDHKTKDCVTAKDTKTERDFSKQESINKINSSSNNDTEEDTFVHTDMSDPELTRNDSDFWLETIPGKEMTQICIETKG